MRSGNRCANSRQTDPTRKRRTSGRIDVTMIFENLPAPLAKALEGHGYTALTPVQASVSQPEALGRDMIVSAQTGSGKTVAFGLAIANELLGDQATMPYTTAPLALVIAPTRELALQVSRELTWLYAPAQARIATCVGGMDASRERRALSHGAHIVVGTPGRLRDHLERGALDLSSLRCVVLDEADEMLDMGFREDLEELLDATPETRRTLLFSATMPKPIEALAKRYQRNSLRISTVGEDRGHGDIAYRAVAVAPAEIEAAVVNLLRFHEAETAMLFCATRDNVRRLHATLVERGFTAVALSGEHSQSERNNALQALRDRRARVCVATDVAARGIDLPSLSLVVHVEIPRDAETLQHRSGRTGRAGKKGTAVLIVPFPRRRRVEMMLRGARINAEWADVPTVEMIRAQDRVRLMETILAPVEADEADLEIGRALLEQRTPEELAAALVRAHRAAMPQPEEMLSGGGNDEGRRQPAHREGFEDTVWFRMDVGRRQNADPRWILPTLCRRGHVSRQEIGAIRITPNDTWFQVPRAIADKFADAVRRTADPKGEDENGIHIEPAPDGPREVARDNRRSDGNDGPRGPRAHPGGPRQHPRGPRPEGKPHRKGPPAKRS
ncbi:ATP-dependent RNA helicase DeaD [Novosphingobium sp. CECT 9465]|nr:ATP-dependent RNA helicase DeaD [Novosphingobium sp. CECT 9465]